MLKNFVKTANTVATLCLSCLAGVCLAKGILEKDNTQLTIGTMGFVVSQIGIKTLCYDE